MSQDEKKIAALLMNIPNENPPLEGLIPLNVLGVRDLIVCISRCE